MPVRPGTVPPGGTTFVPPPPPQLSYGGGGYGPQYPPGMMPYGRTPTPSESPVVPSPPLRRRDEPFIPPDLGPSRRTSIAIPPIYQPPVPGGDEGDIYIPPEPSYSTSRTPSIESRRSPSLAPVPIPGPFGGPGQAPPPIFVHPASQPSPSHLDRTASPGRSRTPPTPPPAGGQTIINMPPQPGLVAPSVPMAPSTQPQYDDRAGQPDFFPQPVVGQPQFQVPLSPRRSERSDFDDRRATPQQPIIIHPPPPQGMGMMPPPGPFGPPGVVLDPGRRRSRSHSPTYSSRSSRPSREGDPMLQPMFPIPPPGPLPGFGGPPGGVTVIGGPSHGPPSEYRDTQMSPRPYPSRPPTRFDEGPIPAFQPPMPMPMPTGVPPTAIHIDPGRGYRPSRYDSRTPPSDRSRSPDRRSPPRGRSRSRTPSYDDREPRRGSSLSYQPPVPFGAGPGYGPGFDPGIGHPVVQPPAVTHVHAYPPQSQQSYPPPSPTAESIPRTDRDRGSDPLPHPFGAPTQYQPEQFPVPTGRAPPGRRPSLAPTVVEVTGPPERIQVHSPDFALPRTASGGKYCNICTTGTSN